MNIIDSTRRQLTLRALALRIANSTLCTIAMLGLVACGGGGGDDDPPDPYTTYIGGVPQTSGTYITKCPLGQSAGVPTSGCDGTKEISGQGAGVPTSNADTRMTISGQGAGVPG